MRIYGYCKLIFVKYCHSLTRIQSITINSTLEINIIEVAEEREFPLLSKEEYNIIFRAAYF